MTHHLSRTGRLQSRAALSPHCYHHIENVPGRLPNVAVPMEITGADVDRWSLAFDQVIDQASMHLYAVYQHLTPEVDLVTRDLAVSPNGKLKNVGAPLTILISSIRAAASTFSEIDVRFLHWADMNVRAEDVCFRGQSGHS